jgi:alkylation response protein AidB-like acyl-CoA dehydrogenase
MTIQSNPDRPWSIRMAVTDYKVDLRDIKFVLFEQAKVQDINTPRYKDYDEELYDMVLNEAAKFSEQRINPVNAPGDRQGCTWDAGSVTTPDGYSAVYNEFCEAGWGALNTPVEFGGQGLPHGVTLACVEMFIGASPAFNMYPGLTAAAANLVRERGTDWMREKILPKLVTGEWTGTMCLTEPQAGSAVGDARTVAHREDGYYRLQGTKIFVSGGEHDLTENIIHLMLARTPDAPAGIRGLSLFVVPKFILDKDGNMGERNDVVCTGIEHKMGINGSATCTLNMGDNGGAKGWIVGDEGQGIQHMFLMMNEARIGVGVQGLAVASAAYQSALQYAKERIQGTAIKDIKDPHARRVPIIEHADVRRMLLWCRSHVSGMRALALTLACWHDAGDEKIDMIEVLTPICKSWCTDQGFEVTRWALQVFGGYGYIGEYPAEQYLRDAKIFSIYEGTNGIQALDLVGRKMRMKGGMAFMAVMNWINGEISELGEFTFAAEKSALEKARDRLGAAAMHLQSLGMGGDRELPVLHACDVLNLFGDVVIATLLSEQGRIAHRELNKIAVEKEVDLEDDDLRLELLESDDEARFYASKIDDFRFFTHQCLPRTAGLLRQISSPDRTALTAVL